MNRVNSLDQYIKTIEEKHIVAENQKKGSDKKGKIGETGFAKIIWQKFKPHGFIFVVSNKNEDMKQHWDTGIIRDNFQCLFEVKNNIDGNDVIVEFQSKYGGNGWVYGKSRFVAFHIGDFKYLIVPRVYIRDFVKKKIKEKGEDIKSEMPREPYIRYKRYGNNDEICRVPIEDLKQRGVIW